jgi:hypothetical protein
MSARVADGRLTLTPAREKTQVIDDAMMTSAHGRTFQSLGKFFKYLGQNMSS